MAKRQFDTPVCIMTDTGLPRNIATPFEAYTFLVSRKSKRLDMNHAMLRQTCSAASMGLLKPQVARAAFVRYAEKNGLLAPDVDFAAMQATEQAPGHASA